MTEKAALRPVNMRERGSAPAGVPLLRLERLSATYLTRSGNIRAVSDVSFSIMEGETLGIVGESGSGKSATALAILGLLPKGRAVTDGRVWFRGSDLMVASARDIRVVRGGQIGVVFQDPMTSLNPVMRIGSQIEEALRAHHLDQGAAHRRAVDLLKMVEIASPKDCARAFPHQLSGGMRQRAMIAMALSCEPRLLIADEPTTALDVTIQAQILDLIRRLADEFKMAVLLISHDLGITAGIADRVAVMYAGRIVETGEADEVFYDPRHPYTRGLLESIPRLDTDPELPLVPIPGSPPDPLHPTVGCPFAPRCSSVIPSCVVDPTLKPIRLDSPGVHAAACWVYADDGNR